MYRDACSASRRGGVFQIETIAAVEPMHATSFGSGDQLVVGIDTDVSSIQPMCPVIAVVDEQHVIRMSRDVR